MPPVEVKPANHLYFYHVRSPKPDAPLTIWLVITNYCRKLQSQPTHTRTHTHTQMQTQTQGSSVRKVAAPRDHSVFS
jgi:hypothetical protein